MSNASTWGALVGLCALSAVAQTAKPSIAPLVLDYERVPALKRQSAALQSTFAQLLESESGVSFLLPGEVETASKTVGRTDFRENDESVMLVAKNAGALYALYSWVQLKPDGDMVLSGRVIRDDGKVMGTASVHQRRGKEALPELLKALVPGYLSELKLKALPVTKAVAGAPVDVKPVPVVPPVEVLPPELPLTAIRPVEPPVAPVSGLRVAGYALVGVGAAAAVTGGVVFALANPGQVTTDTRGVVASGADKVKTVESMQSAGVGLMVGGAGVAAVGAVLWALSPSPVKVSVAPVNQGAMVSLQGAWP